MHVIIDADKTSTSGLEQIYLSTRYNNVETMITERTVMIRKFALATSLVALSLTVACAQESAPNRAVTEEIIKEYILANPEIIEDALIALERKRIAAEEEAKRELVKANTELIFNLSLIHI